MSNLYVVYSLNMTNWLCNHGLKIIKVEDSERNPNMKVFLFEDTIKLHELMIEYNR